MKLTQRQKLGQRLVAGFPGLSPDEDFIRLVREHKVGNIILFKHNIQSVPQLAALCSELQTLVREATGFPAFITIDQEGGCVTRLPPDATNVPGAMAIAATEKPEYAYQAGLITGRELKALGINFNLAPDMDINSNPQNPVIGVRSYGDTPEAVARYGVEMIRGLLQGGVLCTAKHFPGHGDTCVDSHLSLPQVDKSPDELAKMELCPFAAAIAAGIPAIMSSHILFPQLEPDNAPATMSRRIITGLLKEKMGFEGLVVSDCMEMNAIKGVYGSVNGILAALNAGVDLVFVSHTPSVAREAIEEAERALRDGRMDEVELNSSVEKILRYKEQFAQPSTGGLAVVGCAEHRRISAEIMKNSISIIHTPADGPPPLGASPWFLGCFPFRATLASNLTDESLSFPAYLAEKFNGNSEGTSSNPSPEEIAALLPRAIGYSCIIVGTYNGHLNPGQLALVRAMAETGIPTIAVALRNPYDLRGLPDNVFALAAYEYTTASMDAVAGVLRGGPASGRLPVRL